MAEAIGLAASIIGIAEASIKLASGLYKVARTLKHAGRDARDIATQLNTMSSVLSTFAEVIKSKMDSLRNAQSLAEDLLISCEERLAESQELLEKLEPLAHATDAGRRTERTLLRVKWLFEKTRFAMHQESLMALQGTLTLFIATMNFDYACKKTDSVPSNRDYLENCIEDVQHQTRSGDATLQITALQQTSPVVAGSNLLSSTANLTIGNGDLEDNQPIESYKAGDAQEQVSSASNTEIIETESEERSMTGGQLVPYNQEQPVAEETELDHDSILQALVPLYEIRFLQKRTVKYARDVLRKQPQGKSLLAVGSSGAAAAPQPVTENFWYGLQTSRSSPQQR